CPDPVPLKPEYNRYYLSGQVWPAPNPAVAETHFWLAKPLPGGGRFLINASFPYGWDGGGRLLLHNGVDAAEPLGTPVLAAADGVVVVAQADMNAWYGWRCDWYGHLVVVEHDARWFGQPVYTLYGHVLNISVEVGQRVQQGEPVAEVGFGGAATAAHLHFEVRLGSNEFSSTRNPMLWIHPGETRGVIAGRLLDPEGRPWQGVTIHLLDENGDIAATTWSYLDDPLHYINPDEGLAENFVFSDVVPGDYTAYVELQDVIYRQPVTVTAGEVALLEVRTEPYRAPEP
ncbi:MAG: peptidoglycan DD-metalloendopeptidase family protein, partial [Anaerolineales bacterium]|nr:peptidoglycan DD-metalloendopeptidase family protein [Anaerolineales bacterium]